MAQRNLRTNSWSAEKQAGTGKIQLRHLAARANGSRRRCDQEGGLPAIQTALHVANFKLRILRCNTDALRVNCNIQYKRIGGRAMEAGLLKFSRGSIRTR